MESLHELAAWLESLPPLSLYLALFAIAYAENLVPPVPGDVLVVIGGYLVGLGLLGFGPAVAIASAAGGLGFMTMYAIGRRLGPAVEDPARVRWIPKGPVKAVKGWLQRYGYGVVAANRFLLGGRAIIGLMAGGARLRLAPTFVLATASAAAWSTILTYAGFVVGSEWARVLVWLELYGKALSGVLAVAAVVVGVRWYRAAQRGRRAAGDAARGDAPRNREDPGGAI